MTWKPGQWMSLSYNRLLYNILLESSIAGVILDEHTTSLLPIGQVQGCAGFVRRAPVWAQTNISKSCLLMLLTLHRQSCRQMCVQTLAQSGCYRYTRWPHAGTGREWTGIPAREARHIKTKGRCTVDVLKIVSVVNQPVRRSSRSHITLN